LYPPSWCWMVALFNLSSECCIFPIVPPGKWFSRTRHWHIRL
jgi:hypothetical protein